MATFIFPAQSVSISGGATEAKQDTQITELQSINTELDGQTTILTSLDGKDFATETTLAALNAKVTSVDTSSLATETTLSSVDTKLSSVATEATLSALNTKVTAVDTTGKSTEAKQDSQITLLTSLDGKDYATQTTLAALNAKVTAVDTTGKSTEAKQDTMITSLSNIESDINNLESRLAGNLVPEAFDEIELTYVGATEDINTVVYKLSAGTVATLTLSYDGNGRISGVVKS